MLLKENLPKLPPKTSRGRPKSSQNCPETTPEAAKIVKIGILEPEKLGLQPNSPKSEKKFNFFYDFWGDLGPPNPLKIDRNRSQEAIKFRLVFGCQFLSILDAFLPPSWTPKSTFFRFGSPKLDYAKTLFSIMFLYEFRASDHWKSA